MPFRYYRRRSLGGGFNLAITNRGPRLGYRRGRVSVTDGLTGPRFGIQLLRGLWWRNR